MGMWKRTCMVLAGLMVLAVIVEDAEAQRRGDRDRNPLGRMFGQLMQPEFVRRDVALVTEALKLDRSQQLVIEALLDDYTVAFTEATEAMREEMSALRPGADEDDAVREQRRDIISSMRDKRREMRTLTAALNTGVAEDVEVIRAQLEALRAEQDALRDQIRDLRPEMPEGAELEALQDDARRIAREWQRTRAQLREEFLSGIQINLTDRQDEDWASFVREFRRMKSLPMGWVAGESVDLIAMLDELELSDPGNASMAEALLAYELQLDEAIRNRDVFLETSGFEFMIHMVAREVDKAVEVAEQEAYRRIAVRDTNEQFIDIVTAILEADEAELVRQTWLEKAYPQVIRARGTMPAFEAAKSLEGVDDQTMAAIIALETTYAMDRQARTDALIRAMREHQPMQRANRFRAIAERIANRGNEDDENGRRGWDDDDDPIDAARDARRELDERYHDMLVDLLPSELAAGLPELPSQRGRRGDGRGGDRDERRDEDRNAEIQRRLLDRYDSNGDGRLSQEELEKMRDERPEWDDRARRRDRTRDAAPVI